MDKQQIAAFIEKAKLIPVVKIDDVKDAIPLLDALSAGGINCAEITFRTACGPDALSEAAALRPEMLIGAGTVLTAEQTEDAIERGAQFIVSPGFRWEIAEICAEKDILYIGGCVTPSEIMSALEYDSPYIKFFPAESFGGINTIKALAAPFPKLKFIPTGGISAENLAEYLSCKAVAACGGSWMVKDNLIKAKRFGEITALSAAAVEIIKKLK